MAKPEKPKKPEGTKNAGLRAMREARYEADQKKANPKPPATRLDDEATEGS